MIKLLLVILLVLVLAIVGAAIVLNLVAGGEDHGQYDGLPPGAMMPAGILPGRESPEHKALVQQMASEMAAAPKQSRQEAMLQMRKQMDARGEALAIDADVRAVDVQGISAEWITTAESDPNRRLLYLHGGGYVMGSAKSHRLITSRLAKLSKSAVLAINYRLLPEHTRLAGIEDCRTAYTWLLNNGPAGAASAQTLVVAGDSSGGNLALSTVAWVRDQELRAPDAVIVMSPQTDATLGSPSLVQNIETDLMQGASFGPVVKAPRAVGLGFGYLMHKMNPSNPLISPLLGDLSNLPPTLVQASSSEMFLDDAVRYVNKAQAQGSPATLQVWPDMLHVWQAFEVPEADVAFVEMAKFLALHTGVAER